MGENERGKMPKKKANETHSSRCLSVKPTLEQERDLQIIQKEEGTTKSEMMRDALKDYLMHKRLKKLKRDIRKDPTQLLLEKALEEQLSPLRQQVESIAVTLQTLALAPPDGASYAPPTSILSFAGKPEETASGASLGAVLAQLKFLCKLTEQHFHDTMITQRIVAYFLIEQHVRAIQPDESECLELVERVRHHAEKRSKTTAQVFSIIRDQMNGVAQGVANDYKREEGLECVVLPSEEDKQQPPSNVEAAAATII